MALTKDWQNNSVIPPLLSIKELCFAWPSGAIALDECSFFIPSPGLWMIVGSNGSGKSTLFRLISGMLEAQSGQIICSLKPALMFQNPDHQLLLPTCGSDLLINMPESWSIEERWERIESALEQVGMSGMKSRPIHTLSGGQKQRLALAGALVSQANLLLLDEPTALLDPDSQKMVLDIVKKLCSRSNAPLTALWITHRLDELAYSDGAAMMENGKVGPWRTENQIMKRIQPLAIRRG